jgi:hypothetical protein
MVAIEDCWPTRIAVWVHQGHVPGSRIGIGFWKLMNGEQDSAIRHRIEIQVIGRLEAAPGANSFVPTLRFDSVIFKAEQDDGRVRDIGAPMVRAPVSDRLRPPVAEDFIFAAAQIGNCLTVGLQRRRYRE